MKHYLFRLSDILTENLSNKLKDFNISFEEAIICNESLKISYGNSNISIKLYLSLHHLDIPWNFNVKIKIKDINIDLVTWKKHKENFSDEFYEVTPNMLKELNTNSNLIIDILTNDILYVLKEKTIE